MNHPARQLLYAGGGTQTRLNFATANTAKTATRRSAAPRRIAVPRGHSNQAWPGRVDQVQPSRRPGRSGEVGARGRTPGSRPAGETESKKRSGGDGRRRRRRVRGRPTEHVTWRLEEGETRGVGTWDESGQEWPNAKLPAAACR